MISSGDILKAAILIVDDQAANVILLEQILQGAGYINVTSTREPGAVGELHRQNHYDLILLDLEMPGLNGFQVMEKLKEAEPEGYLSILVITAEPGYKLRALKAGAKDFISQPFDLAEVLLRVRNLLEVRLLHRDESAVNLARLDNTQRIAGLGDWDYDFTSQRLLWSGEVYRILGIVQNGQPPDSAFFYAQVHPDDLAFVHREKKKAEHSGRVEFEHRIIRPDGEVRYIHQIMVMTLDGAGRPVRESGTVQDITEHKLAEEILHQSEARFAAAFAQAPIGMALVSPAGRWLKVNRALCDLVGYPEDELLVRTFQDITHPDDLAADLEQVRRMIAGEIRTYQMEKRYIHARGHLVTVWLSVSLIRDEQQRPLYFISQIQDITGRKQAETALLQEQALLSSLISTIPDHIYFKDRQSRFVRINDSMARQIGLRNPMEAVGRTDTDFFTSEHAQPTYRQEQQIMETGEPVIGFEEKETWTSGLVTWASSTKVALRNPAGEIVGLIGVSRDITANKAAEHALRESEERFKLVARAVSDVVWDWDLTADTLWWNDGFLTTFGFAAGEIAPSVEAWTNRIHPDERRRVIDSIDQAVGTGAETWTADYRVLRKDGSHAYVQDRGYILRNAAGQGVRMVGGLRDLTEQRRMETQNLRAQRLESIGTLAGGIAHDLNNVLAPILLSIELLKADAGNDPRRNKILDIIYVSSRRGADLVRQVMSFALGLDGQRVAIRLRHMIDDLVAISSETFPRQIQIVAEVAEDLWPVKGDPTQLHQVLLNLAVNARDAMPQGGTLTIKADNVTIDAQYAATSRKAQAGPYVLLQVTDTGQGIPPAVRERIFDPFFTTKELGKGTGLGLATVHTVVKSHGGFLNVDSEVGRGTTFKIYLPADPSLQTAEPGLRPQIELPRGRDELIMVVDDEPAIRDITKRTLESFGYRVITASDGTEAIALYARQSEQIALVLTDMMMPVMDGFATIQVLQRLNPAIRIIVASGSDSGKNAARVKRIGVKDFLSKPYEAEALLQLVREVLDRPAAEPTRLEQAGRPIA